MAIEFLQCHVYSRSQGRNAVHAAAYRSASRLYDERTGQWFDHTRKSHVVHSEILLPQGGDKQFLNREYLWNEVERAERRKDSQLAKDFILALPKELTLEQNTDLARSFAQEYFVSKGLIVDLNIHLEKSNPHAHILMTTRRLEGLHFSLKKARDLNPQFYSGKVVEKDYFNLKWREFQEQYFKNHDLNISIDPNHLVPTKHRGRKTGDGRAEYIDEENGIRHGIERDMALRNPEQVIEKLSQQFTVFSEKEIAQVLTKATDTLEEFQEALIKVKAHPDLIILGLGDDGRERYATRHAIKSEWQLEADAIKLSSISKHQVQEWRVKSLIEKYGLKDGQESALEHILLGGDMVAVVGKAGTGKSYLMNAARQAWEAQGYRVLGSTVAGVAADNLESGSKIKSSTLASLKKRLEKGKLRLTKNDILVLDEAGMIDTYELQKITSQVLHAGAKLVVIGDPEQVQPIGPGAPLRAILERIGFKELTKIIRQNQEIDKKATSLLSEGKTASALDIYQSKGRVYFKDAAGEAQQALVDQWTQHLTTDINKINRMIILAHRNNDVRTLNLLARKSLIDNGLLKVDQEQEFKTIKGNIKLSQGDRILFLKNDKELDVKNGNFASVTSINGFIITAEIIKDKGKKEISFDARNYQDFTYGYAATVHKTQGVTVNDCFVYAGGKYWSRNLTYVALSRHKDNVYIFADSETHKNFDTLKKHMGRASIKDSVLDYPLGFALRRGIDEDSVVGKCIVALGEIKEKIIDKWLFISNIEAYNERLQHDNTKANIKERRADAVIVAKFVDLNQEIGRSWSCMKLELAEGQSPQQHANYDNIKELSRERDKLAFEIFFKIPKYKLAMDLNGIDSETVKPHAKAYERRKEVRKYEKAVNANIATSKGSQLDHYNLVAGKLAKEIVSNGKEYSVYLQEKNLDWQMAYASAEQYRQRKFYFKLKPEEKALYEDIIQYQGVNKAAGEAWDKFYKAEQAQKQGHAQNAIKQQEKELIAKTWSNQKDELAFKIQNNREAYQPLIEKFKINVERLEQAAAYYQRKHGIENNKGQYHSQDITENKLRIRL